MTDQPLSDDELKAIEARKAEWDAIDLELSDVGAPILSSRADELLGQLLDDFDRLVAEVVRLRAKAEAWHAEAIKWRRAVGKYADEDTKAKLNAAVVWGPDLPPNDAPPSAPPLAVGDRVRLRRYPDIELMNSDVVWVIEHIFDDGTVYLRGPDGRAYEDRLSRLERADERSDESGAGG